MKHASSDTVLEGGNTAEFLKLTDDDLLGIARPLIQLLCEAADGAAEGRQTWVSFGTTRKANSFTLTVHESVGSLSIFGPTALACLENVPELL